MKPSYYNDGKFVRIVGACQNNLKNISLNIPVDQLTVFTGVSGSGKSSLVFGVLAAESQRQLNFTFPAYVANRLPHFGIPNVQHISGLSTAIIVDQKPIGTNTRSTVGTATDIAPLLRLIFSRVGTPYVGYSSIFSFNNLSGMCTRCKGLGKVSEIDESELIDMNKSLNDGAIMFRGYEPGSWYWKWYIRTGLFDPNEKLCNYSQSKLDLLLYAEPKPLKNPPKGWYKTAKYEGVVHRFRRMYLGEISDARQRRFLTDLERIIHNKVCPACGGARLNPIVLSCKIGEYNINDLSQIAIKDLLKIIKDWRFKEVEPAISNLITQLDTMVELGLGYLQLNRATTTISGGEAQRIKIARHLGSSLTRLTYIFDEPSTGLHPRDVRRLGSTLINLRDKGNTIFVVEHDPDIINIADNIVDMGPGAGESGGGVLFNGELTDLLNQDTPTSNSLNKQHKFAIPRPNHSIAIEVRKAKRNNLKSIDINIYKGILTAITGVAGSGKSSLVHEIALANPSVVVINQSPLQCSIRSTVSTYIGIMDKIRQLFSKVNKISPSWFSSASKGACQNCKGRGHCFTELAFLESVKTECEACKGTGYNNTALSYHLEGQTIADVSAMSVISAKNFFQKISPALSSSLDSLLEVGLGYLSLGRPTSTLSGGERQRIKLALSLCETTDIIILDEPTSGLHSLDVQILLSLFHKLVDGGTTVIIVEHNLEAMLASDWIIDLGPGAGNEGGKVVFSGSARDIVDNPNSLTGAELRRYVGLNYIG